MLGDWVHPGTMALPAHIPPTSVCRPGSSGWGHAGEGDPDAQNTEETDHTRTEETR